MSRATGVLIGVLLVEVLAMTDPSAAVAAARWTERSSRVKVDVVGNCFHVEQSWIITGARRGQLLEATRSLTLSGRYGLYGDRQLLKTSLPEAQQNSGEGVDAWASPRMVPLMFGSRARTIPTATGFVASMSGGTLGRGSSEVTVVEAPGGQVEVTERGTYALSELSSGSSWIDAAYGLGAATFGRVPMAAAHKAMGLLHNTAFNAAEPMVNWVNDQPTSPRP